METQLNVILPMVWCEPPQSDVYFYDYHLTWLAWKIIIPSSISVGSFVLERERGRGRLEEKRTLLLSLLHVIPEIYRKQTSICDRGRQNINEWITSLPDLASGSRNSGWGGGYRPCEWLTRRAQGDLNF